MDQRTADAAGPRRAAIRPPSATPQEGRIATTDCVCEPRGRDSTARSSGAAARNERHEATDARRRRRDSTSQHRQDQAHSTKPHQAPTQATPPHQAAATPQRRSSRNASPPQHHQHTRSRTKRRTAKQPAEHKAGRTCPPLTAPQPPPRSKVSEVSVRESCPAARCTGTQAETKRNKQPRRARPAKQQENARPRVAPAHRQRQEQHTASSRGDQTAALMHRHASGSTARQRQGS